MVSLAAGVRRQINHQFASIGLDRLTVSPSGRRTARPDFNPFGFLSAQKAHHRRRMSATWKSLPGVVKVIPEVNLPASVGLELDGTAPTSRAHERRGFPARQISFQELPQPVAGSLELPDSGGIILSQGAARAVGSCQQRFCRRRSGRMWKPFCARRAARRRVFILRVQGISQERSRNDPGLPGRPHRHEELVVQHHEHFRNARATTR